MWLIDFQQGCLENSVGWSCVWVGAYFWSSADCDIHFVVCSYSSFILLLHNYDFYPFYHWWIVGLLLGFLVRNDSCETSVTMCCGSRVCTLLLHMYSGVGLLALGVCGCFTWVLTPNGFAEWWIKLVLRSAGTVPIPHVCHHLALPTF